jgi:hypothetical protein
MAEAAVGGDGGGGCGQGWQRRQVCEQGIATADMGDEGRDPCLLAGPGLFRRLHLETLSIAALVA